MEVSVIGSSQATVCTSELVHGEQRFCVPRRRSSVSFFHPGTRWSNSGLRFTLNAIQAEPFRSDNLSIRGCASRSKSLDDVRLFVGLPFDAVSECNTINHAKAISAGLKALKLLGVEGVEMPVWWGIAEKEAMGKYKWEGYLTLAEMVQDAGLKLHVSLCFHANEELKIPLPEWVSRIGESDPGIFFADRSGHHFRECLSLAVDDLPVLDGKTPVQVYQNFARASSLHSRVSWVHNHTTCRGNGKSVMGICGPHDAPSYDQMPNSNSFFKDHGGSWESPYGNFFLSWYSSQLLSHGNRLLSLASDEFGGSTVTTYGEVPLIHSLFKTRSHPCELTAGFYNTDNRDGYEAVAEMFARNSCKMILPGMNLSDEHQPQESLSSPELLLAQIRTACRK
ncbi:hypothetical protein GH714_019016 [Hevea brasiliensis]|uniref:Beta-amylase n=1 Tax=Hevea brasiliensis TaxID=3981 RepID=A0A6A6MES9_HEVBR|nr:hypothetical protein GH714_019016 [Hevea brasiliensis]